MPTTEDPPERPAEISWDLETTTEPIEVDIAGKPLMNAVGERFDPPIRAPFSILTLRIARGDRVAVYALKPVAADEKKPKTTGEK